MWLTSGRVQTYRGNDYKPMMMKLRLGIVKIDYSLYKIIHFLYF